MLAVLLKYGPRELKCLVLVKLSLVKQHAEVLQDNRELSLLLGYGLELLDGLRGAEEALRRVGGGLCCRLVVARGKKLVESLLVQRICARKAGSRRQLVGELCVLRVLQKVWNDGGVVD